MELVQQFGGQIQDLLGFKEGPISDPINQLGLAWLQPSAQCLLLSSPWYVGFTEYEGHMLTHGVCGWAGKSKWHREFDSLKEQYTLNKIAVIPVIYSVSAIY